MEKNVEEFIESASKIVGRSAAEAFSISISYSWKDEITSPIERILYCAISALVDINAVDEFSRFQKSPIGFAVRPQHSVGKYRADFEVSYTTSTGTACVLVECDSQQFHERTERERRYEKQRDRYFISQGYKSLHFTGSEITQNPWFVAAEIIEAVGAGSKENLLLALNGLTD